MEGKSTLVKLNILSIALIQTVVVVLHPYKCGSTVYNHTVSKGNLLRRLNVFSAKDVSILRTHRSIDTGARFRMFKAIGIGIALYLPGESRCELAVSHRGYENDQKRGVTLASLTGTNPQNANRLVFCVSGQTTALDRPALDTTRRCISFLPDMVEPYPRAC